MIAAPTPSSASAAVALRVSVTLGSTVPPALGSVIETAGGAF